MPWLCKPLSGGVSSFVLLLQSPDAIQELVFGALLVLTGMKLFDVWCCRCHVSLGVVAAP